MAEDFKFQLVFQWPSDASVQDFDRLIAIEETVRASIGNLGVVDGHDIGAGEMNIFVWTDEPRAAFDKIMPSLTSGCDLSEMAAGFRDFEEDDYTPIFPPGLSEFSVA